MRFPVLTEVCAFGMDGKDPVGKLRQYYAGKCARVPPEPQTECSKCYFCGIQKTTCKNCGSSLSSS